MDGPLPLGEVCAPCSFVPGAIGGAPPFFQQDAAPRVPQQVEDREGHVIEHLNGYDPFSEEGDHEWLLHNEIEGLSSSSSKADVEFFNVHSLVFNSSTCRHLC